MPIRVLNAATVGRIAAGEVVERPSSVAKELIENALDAGSTSITVEMREGGTTYLRVTDNGAGIAAGEVRMAFENHATSKIADDDDLTDIRTLGFRGEALPSIAAVSKVEVTTRKRGADMGVKLVLEGGKVASLTEAGCPEGTTIIVRDLFFNVPARKAFLKKPSYEAGVLAEMVARLILGNPKVAMRLIHNGKTQYHSFGDGNMRHAALAVYGRDIASELIEIDEAEGGLRIWGLIGVGSAAKANRSGQSFFVNGRLVRCATLVQAIEQACQGRVMIGMHPMCALNVQLPPRAVDVNVHPNKLEIRFRDELAMRESADALLRRALAPGAMFDVNAAATDDAPMDERAAIHFEAMNLPEAEEPSAQGKNADGAAASAGARPPSSRLSSSGDDVVKGDTAIDGAGLSADARQSQYAASKDEIPQNANDAHPAYNLPSEVEGEQLRYVVIKTPQAIDEQLNERPTALSLPEGECAADASEAAPRDKLAIAAASEPSADQQPRFRVIGVLANTYLLIEIEENLVMIDQHAAHERILFERYNKLLDEHSAAQQLLAPAVVSVTPREMAVLMENKEMLAGIGYEIDPFGAQDIQVRSVPYVLGEANLKMLFTELIDELGQLRHATFEKRRRDLIQFSCKRAVKAGDALTGSEIDALIDAMRATGAPPTCPHGRPVLRVMRKSEIERMFKRV